MPVIVALLVILFFIFSVPRSRNYEDKLPQSEGSRGSRWFEGGTLHDETGNGWERGTRNNRLATAADFVAAHEEIETEHQLYTHARDLSRCISSQYTSENLISKKVSEVSASCRVDLGFN